MQTHIQPGTVKSANVFNPCYRCLTTNECEHRGDTLIRQQVSLQLLGNQRRLLDRRSSRKLQLNPERSLIHRGKHASRQREPHRNGKPEKNQGTTNYCTAVLQCPLQKVLIPVLESEVAALEPAKERPEQRTQRSHDACDESRLCTCLTRIPASRKHRQHRERNDDRGCQREGHCEGQAAEELPGNTLHVDDGPEHRDGRERRRYDRALHL